MQQNQNILSDDSFVVLEKENILVNFGLDGYYPTEFFSEVDLRQTR